MESVQGQRHHVAEPRPRPALIDHAPLPASRVRSADGHRSAPAACHSSADAVHSAARTSLHQQFIHSLPSSCSPYAFHEQPSIHPYLHYRSLINHFTYSSADQSFGSSISTNQFNYCQLLLSFIFIVFNLSLLK